MSTKAVVTGGAGFIGSHLVDELVKHGYDVHVIDDLSSGLKVNVNPKATLHVADIRNFDVVARIINGANYIFHEAALPRVQYSIEHPEETHSVNVNGTLNVLIAASQESRLKKFIYAASSSAYGNQDKMPLREDLHANPISPYGLQKYIGELQCRVWAEVYGLPTVSLRYFNVYGPRASHDGAYALVIAKFLKQRQENTLMTITGDGEQTRDFTHVRDVVAANLLAAESDRVGYGEVMNIGAGKNTSINEIAKLIGGTAEHIEPRLEPKHTLADNSKARELIGWEPQVSLEEGIAELKQIYDLK
jgi:UDP-glucose 4-epimerase